MVRDRGFEPLTPSVSRKCSTTELTAQNGGRNGCSLPKVNSAAKTRQAVLTAMPARKALVCQLAPSHDISNNGQEDCCFSAKSPFVQHALEVDEIAPK